MKKIVWLMILIFLLFSCTTTKNQPIVKENYYGTNEYDQTGLLYSILTGIQLEFKSPLPQSMIKLIYQELINSGDIVFEENKNIILNLKNVGDKALEFIGQEQYECVIENIEKGKTVKGAAFTVRIGLKNDLSMHYNTGDKLGHFLWDPETGNIDLIKDLKGVLKISFKNN